MTAAKKATAKETFSRESGAAASLYEKLSSDLFTSHLTADFITKHLYRSPDVGGDG